MGTLKEEDLKKAEAGTYRDGEGLFIIKSSVSRGKWKLRYQLNGRRRDIGLGSWPTVSLAAARKAAKVARGLRAQGIDPKASRDAERKAGQKIPTFRDIADIVIPIEQARSTNDKVKYQKKYLLSASYCSSILQKPINEITTYQLAQMLRPIWRDKPEVARKLFPLIRRVFDHGRIHLRDNYAIEFNNPAVLADLKALGFDSIKRLTRGHHPSLSHEEIPAFFSALSKSNGVGSLMLRLMILTNVRTRSILLAEWSEFDLKKYIWTVPVIHLKDRLTRKTPHYVPLTKPALEILEAAQQFKTNQLVFPSYEGKPYSDPVMLAVIKTLNTPKLRWLDKVQDKPIVAHGFRSTFNVWATTNRWDHDLVELAMGHVISASVVERAYNRTDLLEERRPLMEAWSEWCLNKQAKNR